MASTENGRRGQTTPSYRSGRHLAAAAGLEPGAEIEIAGRLGDLRVPPGSRLEALRGDRMGQFSIRINDQYRICFVWTAAGPSEVETLDYH